MFLLVSVILLTPQEDGYYRGRYASYWNAFLWENVPPPAKKMAYLLLKTCANNWLKRKLYRFLFIEHLGAISYFVLKNHETLLWP